MDQQNSNAHSSDEAIELRRLRPRSRRAAFSAPTLTFREQVRRRHATLGMNIHRMLRNRIDNMQRTIDFYREERRANVEGETAIEETLNRRERQLREVRRLYEESRMEVVGLRAQFLLGQFEQRTLEHLDQAIGNFRAERTHLQQERALLQHDQAEFLRQIRQLQEYYMGLIAQREQQHAAENEQLQTETRRLHEESHRALQTVEGERDTARSEGMVLREENESLRAEVAQLRSNN
jgi:hypothetical protein